MKVLAINASPHMDKGNTAMILDPFLEGLREAGADVDLFYTRKLKIDPCLGDLSCWLKLPGECAVKDDMQMLYPKFHEADVIVFATPVYYLSVPGPLKNLIDRQMPLHVPGARVVKKQKIVLVATCGAWEISMFDLLLKWMEALYGRGKELKGLDEAAGVEGASEFAGALLRPHADTMKPMLETQEGRKQLEEVFRAAMDAGRQFAKEGRISDEVLQGISRALMSKDEFYQAVKALPNQTEP
jgi:multimeric flavodoxin WrbA